jgi:polar amino acid transport system substrate-binding protein
MNMISFHHGGRPNLVAHHREKKMMITRRLIVAAAAAMMMASSAPAMADLKFGVAAEPYAPYTSKDASGKWVGWEIDLMDALCAEMKEKCELVEVAWDGIIPALTSKQIDVIWSSMSVTEERKKTIDFSDWYYDTPSVLIGTKNGDMDISPEHLKGKVIGVQVSTTHERYAQKYFAPAGAEVKTYATQDEANNDLAAGRLDYAQADSTALSAYLATSQGTDCCEMKGTVPEDPVIFGPGVGAGIRQEDTALRDKINVAIAELVKAGKFDEITAKYPELKGIIATPKAK